MGLLINIDNGGTFTDVSVIDEKKVVRTKTLTTPYDLTKCFVEVLKAASKEQFGKEDIRELLNQTDYIRYSTTAGTNAIVQKKGPRIGLMIREGTTPSFLLNGEQEKEMFESAVGDRVVGINCDENGIEFEASVVSKVNQLLLQGANYLVISLGGSDLIKDEKRIKKIILEKFPRHLLGTVPTLLSHELIEDRNDANRTWSAIINSFLHSQMESFLYNAENFLRDYRVRNPLLIFHNDGNSSRVAKTTAIKTYGSGPRGGMEGAKAYAMHYKLPNVLTMDIGGTTTDIGLVKEEKIEEHLIGEIEGIPTSFSLSDLISVGAGGSSIFHVNNGTLFVGPQSVGAAPGPACFARGGQEPTITDAYLLMGILDSQSYLGGNMVLDASRSQTVIEEKVADLLGVSLEEALIAMERKYVEKVAEGLKRYTEQSNDDLTLLAFGGAGPMSACGAAKAAGIKKIIIPRLAAVFSSFGISFSDIAHEYQANLFSFSDVECKARLAEMEERAGRDMFAEGFDISECQFETYISYLKDGSLETIPTHSLSSLQYSQEITNVRVHYKVTKPITHFSFEQSKELLAQSLEPKRYQNILQDNGQRKEVPVYQFENMSPGTIGHGPALIEDELFTCRVLENWTFEINENKDIFLHDQGGNS